MSCPSPQRAPTGHELLVWAMVGIAIWHFAVLVPDKFLGGIIGAFLAALFGAFLTAFLLPSPGVPLDNPPGVAEALWPMPGSLALGLSYALGVRREAGRGTDRRR